MPLEIPALETERLILRAPEPGDFAWAAFCADGEAARFIGGSRTGSARGPAAGLTHPAPSRPARAPEPARGLLGAEPRGVAGPLGLDPALSTQAGCSRDVTLVPDRRLSGHHAVVIAQSGAYKPPHSPQGRASLAVAPKAS